MTSMTSMTIMTSTTRTKCSTSSTVWPLAVSLSVVFGAISWPVTPARGEENLPPPGFTALFNGKNLAGFYGWGTRDPGEFRAMSPAEQEAYKQRSIEGTDAGDHLLAHWKVDGGELVNDGTGLYATTDRDFGDFELFVDYKILPKGDSGIYLRGLPQVQIWDSTNEDAFKHGADKGSGGLWNNAAEGKFPLAKVDRPLGEWNRLHVTMIGERVTVELNGEVVVDDAPLDNYFSRRRQPPSPAPNGFFPDPPPSRGPIQLQTHGSEVRWRNVFIREIPPEEANRWLASRDADGFVELVNGRDLSNWQGAVDSYEVRDGAIVCRPGQGGDLLSQDEFENGTIRLEFRLPEAGNNGLALRTPLGGHSAADGLELQVIDTDGYNARLAAKGQAPLLPYQTHGSLYFCAGAKQGHLRPAGEWNFQEIDIDGQRIRVTLNGTKILDLDLDALDRNQIEKVPGGLDRRSGLIGLAGHNDPVAFRSFRVRKR